MKALAFLALVLLAQPAHADEWTDEDTIAEAAYLALHVIDWGQTRNMALRDGYYEHNPALGIKPHSDRVNLHFAAGAVLHPLVARALPRPWREGWFTLSIIVEAGIVAGNHRIGLKVDF